MRTFLAAIVIAVAIPSAAAQFPLRIQILGTSESTQEYRHPAPSICISSGMGAPCKGDDDFFGWQVDVLTVTGRMMQRGRMMEYSLVCKSAAPRRPCAPMKYGQYPARWRGKQLEVLIEDGPGKNRVNRFEVRYEQIVDPN